MTRVAVVGTTSWGTTLAALLARNGSDVVADRAQRRGGRRDQRRPRERPPPPRPDASRQPDRNHRSRGAWHAPTSWSWRCRPPACAPTSCASPRRFPRRRACQRHQGHRVGRRLRMSEVIESFGIESARILALSGPNFAGEIAARPARRHRRRWQATSRARARSAIAAQRRRRSASTPATTWSASRSAAR